MKVDEEREEEEEEEQQPRNRSLPMTSLVTSPRHTHSLSLNEGDMGERHVCLTDIRGVTMLSNGAVLVLLGYNFSACNGS